MASGDSDRDAQDALAKFLQMAMMAKYIYYCLLTKWEQQVVSEPQDSPFQPKTANGDAKPESQWTPDERRMESPSSPQNPKTLQPKNKGLVAEIIDWDEDEIYDNEEVTQIKVLMALTDDELTVRKSRAQNGEWVDITIRKKNAFIPASIGYDQEMVTKIKDSVERLNPDSKLPNFNTGRILVPKSQAVNESFETLNTPESSKDSEAEFLTPLPPLKNLQGASPSSKVNSNQETQESTSKTQKTESSKLVDSSRMSQDSKPKVQNTGSSKSLSPKPIQKPQLKYELCHYTNHSTDDCYRILYCMICKREDHRTSDHEMYIASFKRSESYKAQPYQYASTSKQILKAKAKPFPPCIHYGFNNHRPDDCRNYPECKIYGSYNHSTLGHNHVIHIRGGVLVKSSQSNESLIRVKCNTCGSTVHSTSDHNEFDHFKREKPSPKVVFGDNSPCITEGYGSINCEGTIFNANKEIVLIAPRRNDVYVLDMSSLTPNGACFFAKASKSINWLWHKRLSYLNFKNINKLAKQNKVLGLPSLVYSKDKPYTACEKGKHHRASFKTKQNFSIKKCLHLLHMDLFGPDIPLSERLSESITQEDNK
nr:hypothetical protein [Tanacetum cinerariifolium]